MPHVVRIERIQDEIRGVASQYGVTSWDRDFLSNVKQQQRLSERQLNVLADIERKVFKPQKGQ